MNRNCYRLVFNKARGIFIAVAETAVSQTKATGTMLRAPGSAYASTWTTWRRAAFLVLSACGLITWSPIDVQAQVVADPGAPAHQRPSIGNAANGVPLVNIQTPSAAGVSRNLYSQFDVQQQGAILNNSRTNVQTQQAGWVQGNPYLAGGTARIILNEVNSSDPSFLHGYVEVAGSRAQVVIANPAGISCDGCGFINADRSTLTTGTPIIDKGSLDGYRVQGGTITISGTGFDDCRTDFTDLIARSVQVNAGIWANQLKITGGANEVNAANTDATVIAGIGAAPAFVIDVAALGGMYAGKIRLVGTESGVGMRNAGNIGATAGDVTIDAGGLLQNNGTISAASDIQLDALALSHTGAIEAVQNVSIGLASDYTNTAAIQAGGDFTFDTTGHITNHAALRAAQTLTINAYSLDNAASAEIVAHTTTLDVSGAATNRGLIDGVDTTIRAATVHNLQAGSLYGDHLAIEAGNLANESGAVIAARDRLDIGATTIDNRSNGLLFSAGDFGIGSSLDTNGTAIGSAVTLVNEGAIVEALGNLHIDAETIHNLNAGLITEDVVTDVTHYDQFTPRGESVQLDSADYPEAQIGNYNISVRQAGPYSFREYWRYLYTGTTTETQMLSSMPGKILAGGDLRLHGNVENRDSQIIAGNTLEIIGNALQNINTAGSAVTAYRGTAYYYDYDGNESCSDASDGCYDISSQTYNPADMVLTYNLPTSTVAQHATPAGSGAIVAEMAVPTLTGALFHANPDPQGGYLIETDKRFASYRTWLSSDYMMQQLALDPTLAQKRLGDGFYEQRLVREQIAQLTGRRFVDGYANDEAQYQALMNAGITYAADLQLIPGVALSAAQIAQLTSDIVWLVEKEVTLPDGTVTRALVPQVYVQLQVDDLNPTTGLMTGNTVSMEVAGDITNSGTIAGRTFLSLDADNIQNIGGVVTAHNVLLDATHDFQNIGGSVIARDALIVEAGNDITLATTTQAADQRYGANRFTRTNLDRVAGLYVTGDSGLLLVSAGNDVNLEAATIVNHGLVGTAKHAATTSLSGGGSGVTMIDAGGDINLGAVTIAEQNSSIRNANNYLKHGGTQEIGSTIEVTGDIALSAGNDFIARAATIHSEAGAIEVDAGRDIRLEAGRETSNFDAARKVKRSGTFSSTTTTYRDTFRSDTSIGSSLSGATVTMQAGRHIGVKASNVVSDKGTTLLAGKDINIEAVTDSSAETHFKKEKKSGLFSSGGLSLTYGTQQQSVDQGNTRTHAAASSVGSVEGDVAIRAGETYKQVGSNLLAPQGDIDITAQKVDIEEARETSHYTHEHKFKQSGISVTLTSPIISAVQTAEQMYQASKDTDDPRLKALAGGTAALSGYNAYSAVESGQGTTIDNQQGQVAQYDDAGKLTNRDANAADKVGGINVSISLGSSKNQSKSEQTSNTVAGSTVSAGGDVNITATGAGEDSDLTVRGSTITARNDINLSADDAINLLAAQNTYDQTSTNKGSSASVGIGFALGGSQNGFTLNAGVSAQRGNADGEDVSHTNTHVTAGNTLTVDSGGDTNLKGAVAAGKQVAADVGGDLNIESLQDTSTYESEQKSGGVSVSLCIPPFCYGPSSGSANYSRSDVEGNYASVTEQSGIKAGDDGFQIDVAGNTDLKGAIIASTDKAIEDNKNTLTTGTLTTSDIYNYAKASASSSGFNLSSDMLTQGKYGLVKALVGNGLNNSDKSVSSDGETRTTVSDALIEITDQAQQVALTGKTTAETIAELDRDTTTAHVASQKQNVEALRIRVEAERIVKQEAVKIAAIFTDEAYRVSFLEKTSIYKVERDAESGEVIKDPHGNTLMVELTEAEKLTLKPEPGGKLNVFTNGIFNDRATAADYAAQMSELPPGQDIYLVYYPKSNDAVSELVVAGYQKFLEGSVGDLANATQEMRRIMEAYGEEGLNLVGHSRGAMTIGNALESLAREAESNSVLTGTNIKLISPAYNAQETADLLDQLSYGNSPNVKLQNHADDFVGTIIGGNPATYDQRPAHSNRLNEWLRIFSHAPTVHSCGGTGAVSSGCRPTYGTPVTVEVQSNRNK